MKTKILRILALLVAPLYLLGAWLKAIRLSKKREKLKEEYDNERAYKFVLRVIRFYRLIKGMKIETIGIEKFSLTPGLIVANHQSKADVILLMLALLEKEKLPQDNAFIAKVELEKEKIFSPFIKSIRTHFIDRGNVRQIVEVFDAAKKEITENKINLVIFPEGTRSKKKDMNPFNPGAFKLAIQTYAPIKPVVLIDTYRLFEEKEKRIKKIKVVFLDEIPADKVMTMNTIGLANYLQLEMKKVLDQYSLKETEESIQK